MQGILGPPTVFVYPRTPGVKKEKDGMGFGLNQLSTDNGVVLRQDRPGATYANPPMPQQQGTVHRALPIPPCCLFFFSVLHTSSFFGPFLG